MWFMNHASPRTQAFFVLTIRIAVGVQLDVVAHAAAERAGGVLRRRSSSMLRSPCFIASIWPSEPDGMTNVQPSARPWQLPRIRRGMYRPASTSSQAADARSGPARR